MWSEASKALAKVTDAIDEDGADVKVLVGRVREREKLVDQLKAEIGAGGERGRAPS